jgi:tetratricopeptide (TPR) repeat protein
MRKLNVSILGGILSALAVVGVIKCPWFGPQNAPEGGKHQAERPDHPHRRPEGKDQRESRGVAANQPAPSVSEQYEAALLEALDWCAQHNFAKALNSLKAAQTLQDTDQIRQEIERVRVRLEQQGAAERTMQDIQAILKEGKAEEAARLAAVGLQQYGGSQAEEKLCALKREADALVLAAQDDRGARQGRYQAELQTALRDQNLRNAAIALEQMLDGNADPALQQQLNQVRATLARYDDNRKRAAELRGNPDQLEEALAALQQARQAWDTLEVQQEIQDCTLALEHRRDRLAVADFEVRGDVGIPGAGRTIAEELLPAFKGRFNLVERSQLGKVLDELRLGAAEVADNDVRRCEVGRLAGVRYLVVGSVTPMSGALVNARLVDVRTGLVVQTARIVAASPEDLLRRLPELAHLLLMTDEQKFAYEQDQARQAAVEVAPVQIAVLPAPPEPPADRQALPPPVVVFTTRPPEIGRIRPEDFNCLLPPDQPAPRPVIVVEQETRVKNRLLQVLLQLGDNLFRRGRYREAHTHFEFALKLSPERKEIGVRVARCQRLAPPPPPVVIVPVAKPRIAVLSFVVNAPASMAPPGMGEWAADQVTCQFRPAYEVVERGELFWYMGRLGLTVRDVLTDSAARRWLARALNVRFFVFGVVQQTASFDVSTHLVEAETGVRQGAGRIHVQDHQELKLRIGELAGQTVQKPSEQARLQREAQENERLLKQAKQWLKMKQPERAAEVCKEGLKRRPDNVALRVVLQQAEQQLQLKALEEARHKEYRREQALAAAARKRQEELARQAEAARARAEKEARARSQAARLAQEQQRGRAHEQLLAQGQRALQQRNYAQAIQLFESAQAVKPTEAGQTALALAKAQAANAEKEQAAARVLRQQAEFRQKQDAEVARTRERLAAEQRRRDEEGRRQAEKARTDAQAAQALQEQKRRQAAEAQRVRKQMEEYNGLMARGRQALAGRRYDEAVSLFSQAERIEPKPVGPGGQSAGALLKEAIRQRSEAQAGVQAAARKKQEEQRRGPQKPAAPPVRNPMPKAPTSPPPPNTRPAPPPAKTGPATAQPLPKTSAAAAGNDLANLLSAGVKLEQQQKFAEALGFYQRAVQMAPRDGRALEGRKRCQFFVLIAEGQKALAARQFAKAARHFEAALQLYPRHPAAVQGLQQARQGKP